LGRTVINPETGVMQPIAIGQTAADIARSSVFGSSPVPSF
jgi:hypothetical protein